MPDVTPDTVAAAAADADAEISGARQQALGAAAPQPAEPIDPGTLSRVMMGLEEAAATLTGGQVPPEMFQVELPPGPAEVVPPEVFAPMSAFAAGLDQAVAAGVAQAEQYTFDPMVAAESNEGLEEVAAKLMAASEDRKLAAAMQQPAGQASAPPEAPEQAEEAEPPQRRDRMRQAMKKKEADDAG